MNFFSRSLPAASSCAQIVVSRLFRMQDDVRRQSDELEICSMSGEWRCWLDGKILDGKFIGEPRNQLHPRCRADLH